MKSATATERSLQPAIQPITRSVAPTEVRLTDKPTESPTPKQESASTSSPDEEQIRRRAYELYLEDGSRDGNQEQHWFAAQRELSGKTNSPK